MKKTRFKKGDIVVFEGKERVVRQFPYELATRGIGVLLEPSASDKQRGLSGVAAHIDQLGAKIANDLVEAAPALAQRSAARKLRYTGDWPPPKVLKRYPNWEMAYDEEGLENQDETTLRPEEEQTVLTSDTAHTAGDVWLADGRTYPAIITVAFGPPEACSFHDGKRWWAIKTFRKKWEPQLQTYLPGDKRETPLDLLDERTFPLRIRTRLPRRDGKYWQIEIQPDGTEKEWK